MASAARNQNHQRGNAVKSDTLVREVAPAESGTDLIIAEAQQNAVALFTDEARYSDFYERVKQSVSGFVPDVKTDRGRREIASVAFKVTKAKTTLDKAGLTLTEEWRQRVNAVNAARKKMTTELDELAAEVRRPLTEWEEAEDARQDRCSQMLNRLRSEATVQFGETAADVRARFADIEALTFDAAEYEGFAEQVTALREQALSALSAAAGRLDQEERDWAELERLRREQEERTAREAELARQREEEEARSRAEQERARLAKEAEERRQREIAEAAERARREADEQARAEERREAEQRLAEERSQRQAAEREAEDARRKEQERAAWEAKERREREAREADERHRKAVLRDVRDDLIAAGLAEEQAKTAALAIGSGSIRHLTVRF